MSFHTPIWILGLAWIAQRPIICLLLQGPRRGKTSLDATPLSLPLLLPLLAVLQVCLWEGRFDPATSFGRRNTNRKLRV